MLAAEKKGFKAWLQLEKSLSDHSVEAYLRDIEKLSQFLSLEEKATAVENIKLKDLQTFLKWIGGFGHDCQLAIKDHFRHTFFF
ncbi:MAG: site-specific integrase [Puia sp.]